MQKTLTIITFLLLCIVQNGFAQCGTVIPKDQLNNPILVPDQNKSQIEFNLNKTLSVHVYIIAAGFNSYDYGAAQYLPIWDIVNEIFEPLNLQFEICQETLIPNYNYNSLSNELQPDEEITEEAEMFAQFHVDSVINVYYVEEVTDQPDVQGYAYLPGGQDAIVLRKDHADLTIEHELGHFFGLYHTFEDAFGNELVNGDNCATTGDFLCDTPADNAPGGGGCPYETLGTDLNGDYYTPFTSNIMSYFGDCRCKFTNDQYNRMAWMYLNQRNYLW